MDKYDQAMDPKLLQIGLQMLKAVMGGKSDSESTRALIQEELRKSQTQENRDMLQQMLSALEQKYAANFQEVNLEKEKYKLEAEFLRKKLQDAEKEKKSAERADKMKEILNHLSQLSLQKNETPLKNQKEKATSPQSCSSQSNYSENKLPWMESSKGNKQSTSRGSGHHRGQKYHNNFTSQPKSQQNYNLHKNTNVPNNLQQTQFQSTMQANPYLLPQPFVVLPNQNLPLNHNFHLNQNMQQNVPLNAFVQPNPNFQPQYCPNNVPNLPHNVPNNAAFQQNSNSQQRGHNRYRGRGQQGNSGRGRSSSVGRDKAQMNKASDDAVPSSSFHIQVTKVDHKWVSSEKISRSSDASSQRGRGNPRGRGRGRGRGAGNNLQGMDGTQAEMKKNRRKNNQPEQTEYQKQHVPRNKQKNNEEDPEDNCNVS